MLYYAYLILSQTDAPISVHAPSVYLYNIGAYQYCHEWSYKLLTRDEFFFSCRVVWYTHHMAITHVREIGSTLFG